MHVVVDRIIQKGRGCMNRDILNDYREKPYFDEYVSDSRWTADIILNNLYLNDDTGTAILV